MRKHLAILTIAVALAAASWGTGCNRPTQTTAGPPALPPAQSPTVAPPWQPSLPQPDDPGQLPPAGDVPAGHPGNPSEPAATGDSRPLDDDQKSSRRPSRTRLIQGLSDLAESVPIEEEQKNELLDSLSEADEIFAEIKDENRRAIADLNRQVQLKSEHHPHIVLILANQLSAAYLESYATQTIESPTTPTIDRIAVEGAVFRQFYAGGSDLESSFWTILTGRDTSQAKSGLPLPSQILAEMMWKAGYQTAFVGHWASEPKALARGFDDWFSAAPSQDPHFPEYILSGASRIRVPKNAAGAKQQFADELYTEEALSVLRRRDRRRPLFLVVSYNSPAAASALGVGDIQRELTTKLDRDIERIDDELTKLDMNKGTALIITSHTAPASGHLAMKGALGDLYEGGLRVPMIIRWPMRIRPEQSIEEPFGTWDLLPTFAAMSGAIRVPSRLDGSNALPYLIENRRRKKPGPMRRMLYWEQTTAEGKAQAVRMGDWKVVRQAGHTRREDVELYNLIDDPREASNVADHHPRILEAFLRED